MEHIWAVPVLASILILGTLGLSQEAFAQQAGNNANENSNKVLTGAGPPPEKLGNIDDVYIDTSTEFLDYYIKIDKDTWELRGNLQGPPGPQGDVGPQGEQGPPGVPCDGCVDSSSIADDTIQLDDLSPELKVFLSHINQVTEICPNPNSLGFIYTGQVTSVLDNNNLLSGGISVGDPIQGFYCYDPNTPDNVLFTAARGSYNLESYAIKIGLHNFNNCSLKLLEISDDNTGRDGYDVFCSAMSSSFYSFQQSVGNMQLSDLDQTIFVDDSLPLSAPDLNEFEENRFIWDFEDQSQVFNRVSGTITSLVQIQ